MDGLSRTRHWAWGAVIAVLCSFAYAKGAGVPHGGGGAYARGGADRATHMPAHAQMRGGGPYGAMAAQWGLRDPLAGRDPRSLRGGGIAEATYSYGFNGSKSGVRRVGEPSGRAGERGRMQYPGVITPVSAETRPVPRSQQNVPMRNGSIRADVARYNEERGPGRAFQRPNDDPRQPEGSPYRN
ncbi:hypothetical protein LJ656_33090 [Paraburkholderia sp. MMS20-SJTR3]|uniref:Peptide-binding protein n=1 Tax=Paraburkholderia sejongensis TaxID=2886946 RepID=A0ABS8K5G5_9BURK|nr:hypothetical protein [Paraburkholderia sp. MMS20-SJTR3]MCC8397400.1 hypothetical protein [Paraburkholderia sp. MMS20-SJTR3]